MTDSIIARDPKGLSRKCRPQFGQSRRGDRVKRRDVITLLGGAAAAWPLAARAQQAGKLPTIGYLGGGGPITQRAWVDAFVQRLRELGWIEGRTVAIEYRWGEGRPERYAEIAAEFVQRKVDVILANGTEPAVAAKQTTSVIPIIVPAAGDPIGSRLVASLARPGGNVTGLSNLATDLAAKRLELLREVFPNLRRLAVMANADFSGGVFERNTIDAAARTLGLELVSLPIRRAEDIASAFEGLKARAEALYTIADPLANTHRLRINTFALAARLPTMFAQREYVEAAGLMSYGANVPDLNRRAAEYVDKVLRGAKPADLPVEQPTKFDLTINLITAKALGVTVPPTLLARADEVIE
jgi:putative ABC transport system substrate-binding protein